MKAKENCIYILLEKKDYEEAQSIAWNWFTKMKKTYGLSDDKTMKARELALKV